MARRLILVRHPPVAKAWSGRCYGQSDIGLSRAGQAMIPALVDELTALRPDVVIHSGLRRTRALAQPVAARLALSPITLPQWQERHFGAWEGETWNAIYRATGNAMDGMVDDPDGFRPGETGETTAELIARIRMALQELPDCGRVAIVSHGGPIAVSRMLLAGGSPSGLAAMIIPPGTFVVIDN